MKEMTEKVLSGVVFVVVAAFVYVVAFLITAALTWLVCWGLGLPWSWPIALAVFAACLILRWVVSAGKKS